MGELVDVVRAGPVARVVMHRAGNNSIAADLMWAAWTGRRPAPRSGSPP
jgi:hypothetical protein